MIRTSEKEIIVGELVYVRARVCLQARDEIPPRFSHKDHRAILIRNEKPETNVVSLRVLPSLIGPLIHTLSSLT